VEKPSSTEELIPFVFPHKDTGAFVHVLAEMTPEKCLQGVSEYMTWSEWTKLWEDTLGVTAVYKEVGKEEFMVGASDLMRKEIWAGFRYAAEFGYTGGDPDVLGVDQVN
jgi:hypothetical protein